MSALRVHVDRRKCEGTGFCTAISDEVFALDADGLAVVRLPPGDPRLAALGDLVDEAEQMCPTGAIAALRDA